MPALKYTVIKNKTQYNQYCKTLAALLTSSKKNKSGRNEIDLLTLLIDTWDKDHKTLYDSDPVEMLKGLMDDHNLKAKDLVGILDVSKGLVSDILNYKKGLSKDIIRKLSDYFKVSQEAFNRDYRLNAISKNKPSKVNRSSPRKKHFA